MDEYFKTNVGTELRAPLEIEKFKSFISEFISLESNVKNLTKELKIKKERYKKLMETIQVVMNKMKIERIKTDSGVLFLKTKKNGQKELVISGHQEVF